MSYDVEADLRLDPRIRAVLARWPKVPETDVANREEMQWRIHDSRERGLEIGDEELDSDQTLLGEGLLHLADSPPESSPNHPFHCQRIPHRIPAAVVVKVHEHVSAHALPLPHAVRPPAQIVLAIGARVKMMMVGPRETSPIQKKIGPPRA